jgi:hypothetical protein
MDTERNQETRRTTLSAWRKRRQTHPREEAGSSRKETRQARSAGKTGADVKEDEVNESPAAKPEGMDAAEVADKEWQAIVKDRRAVPTGKRD